MWPTFSAWAARRFIGHYIKLRFSLYLPYGATKCLIRRSWVFYPKLNETRLSFRWSRLQCRNLEFHWLLLRTQETN